MNEKAKRLMDISKQIEKIVCGQDLLIEREKQMFSMSFEDGQREYLALQPIKASFKAQLDKLRTEEAELVKS